MRNNSSKSCVNKTIGHINTNCTRQQNNKIWGIGSNNETTTCVDNDKQTPSSYDIKGKEHTSIIF